MNRGQRILVGVVLIALAVALHVYTLDWHTGSGRGLSAFARRLAGDPVLSIGELGCYPGRDFSRREGIVYGVMGPLVLLVAGLYVLLGARPR